MLLSESINEQSEHPLVTAARQTLMKTVHHTSKATV